MRLRILIFSLLALLTAACTIVWMMSAVALYEKATLPEFQPEGYDDPFAEVMLLVFCTGGSISLTFAMLAWRNGIGLRKQHLEQIQEENPTTSSF